MRTTRINEQVMGLERVYVFEEEVFREAARRGGNG